jgi:uncharacterized protein YjbI with pentapeptide repeats
MARDALVVGINCYQYSGLPNLNSPALDAEAIAALLEQYGDFRVTRLPEAISPAGQPYVSQGLELGLDNLEKALEKLFMPEGRSIPDTALFYFSGHGLRKKRGVSEGFLASSDCDPQKSFWGLSLRWLRELLEASPIKQQIVLLDCCHSGELFNFNEANPGDRGLARDRCFIAASREFEAAQVSLDSEYSVLTQALLQGLDPQRQANITNFGLVDYLDQQLGNSTQRPIYSNFGEPIILTRAIIPLTPPHLPTPLNPSHSDQCPYKGLRYFDIADADYFFGREDLINQLIDRVRQENFLAILGASGSGKSSVLRAGLIYELMQGQRLNGSRHWSLKIIVPTAHPLQSLAKLFVDANLSVVDEAIETDKTIEFLQKGGDSFKRLIAGYLNKNSQSKFLLIIDQFEETFTLCEDLRERNQFLACLLEILASTQDNFKLILGMRIDFLGKCFEQDYHGLGKLIEANLITVLPLNPEQLQRAITEPAKKANLELEAGLVEQMLKDGGNQPGSLPLVQDALMELFYQRVNNSLKLSVYVKLGGISGTLNKRATAFYNGLSASEKETVKYIFLALTHLGEGTENTRRRVLKQDLITVKYTEGIIDLMIQKLADERLIVTDKPGETTDKKRLIEVAHEALIREWDLLRQWLDQDRANLLQQRKIEALAQEWENSGRKSAYLLLGFRLKEAIKFQEEQALQYPLKKLGGDFIAESIGQQWQDWLKLGVIPLIITFFGVRTYIVQSSWKIVQETQGDKYDVRRINALEDLVFWKESLANIYLDKANLPQIQLPNANLESANLKDASLSDANLESANLTSAYLFDANLASANLYDANLASAYLSNAYLSNADLEGANLYSANLYSADLEGANLYSANLFRANLKSANLTSANLYRANLSNAKLDRAYLKSANLARANLDSATLSNAYLDSAYLYDAKLDRAYLSNAKLDRANLESAYLSNANLKSANLTSANLFRANLTSANLTSANLTSTNLTDAKNLTNTQIKLACFWDKAIYKRHFDAQEYASMDDEETNQAFIAQLNQDFIAQLKQDKASDPEVKPDCSMWKK